MLQLEASFGSLAWAGQHYPQRKTDDGPVAIHAQIVGAQVCNSCRLAGVLQSSSCSQRRFLAGKREVLNYGTGCQMQLLLNLLVSTDKAPLSTIS